MPPGVRGSPAPAGSLRSLRRPQVDADHLNAGASHRGQLAQAGWAHIPRSEHSLPLLGSHREDERSPAGRPPRASDPLSWRRLVLCLMTASLPAGMGAPVKMRAQHPGSRVWEGPTQPGWCLGGSGWPLAQRSRTSDGVAVHG